MLSLFSKYLKNVSKSDMFIAVKHWQTSLIYKIHGILTRMYSVIQLRYQLFSLNEHKQNIEFKIQIIFLTVLNKLLFCFILFVYFADSVADRCLKKIINRNACTNSQRNDLYNLFSLRFLRLIHTGWCLCVLDLCPAFLNTELQYMVTRLELKG
jgi:hypothetical protein